MTLACESIYKEIKPISNSNIHKEISKNYLQGVSPKEYPCETCKKKFKTKKGLETHLLKCLRKSVTKKQLTTKLETKPTESLPNNTSDVQATIHEQQSTVIQPDDIKNKVNTLEAEKEHVENKDNGDQTLCNQPLVLNNIKIATRQEDGYINLSALCKAGNKEFSHWKENKKTENFLAVLSSSLGIPRLDLLKRTTGGIDQRHVWGHPQVAINIAQWISPEFDVQVSKWIFELMLTGKVELGKEKSSAELDNIYQTRIQELNDKLKRYECSLFDRDVDVCPVEFFGKDVIYFLRYKIPEQLLTTYSSSYPNITNEKFACIEFGITSNLEQRLQTHKKDKRKNEVIFTHAFKLDKRYTASKIEYYIKTIAKQLGVNFEYERSKESILVNEVTFNVMLNRIKEGIDSIEPCADIEVDDSVDNSVEDSVKDIPKTDIRLELRRLELNHELEFEKHNMTLEIEKQKMELELEIEKQKMELENKKHQRITDLIKNDKITFEQYTELLRKI